MLLCCIVSTVSHTLSNDVPMTPPRGVALQRSHAQYPRPDLQVKTVSSSMLPSSAAAALHRQRSPAQSQCGRAAPLTAPTACPERCWALSSSAPAELRLTVAAQALAAMAASCCHRRSTPTRTRSLASTAVCTPLVSCLLPPAAVHVRMASVLCMHGCGCLPAMSGCMTGLRWCWQATIGSRAPAAYLSRCL